MKYSLLEARTTSIASSTSPIATPVGQYVNINSDNFDYDCAHFLVQASDTINNHHQLSEVLVQNRHIYKNYLHSKSKY